MKLVTLIAIQLLWNLTGFGAFPGDLARCIEAEKKVANAPVQFVADTITQGLYLANQSGRTVGVEVEFGGLRNRTDIEELAHAINGHVEFTEVDGIANIDRPPKGKQKLATVHSKELGPLRVEDEGISRETKNDGTNPHIITTSDGQNWRMGIELVTDPMTPTQRMHYNKLVNHLKKKNVKSIQDKWTTGIHVNVGAEGITPRRLKKFLKWWAKNHSKIYGRFKPSPLRSHDGKNFYGPFKVEFINGLDSIPDETISMDDIRNLAFKHYGNGNDVYSGFDNMQKFIDINLNPLSRGYGNYMEFRLFNADFHPNVHEKETTDALDFCVSAVELASRDLLPEY